MRLEVHLTPATVTEHNLVGKTAVVIDVLRATSTITTALENGCLGVIPVASKTEALQLKLPGRLLAGESAGHQAPGFDLGNSPTDFTSEQVRGKVVVIATTNGTPALCNATKAASVVVACLLNAGAVALQVIQQKRDIVVICAGHHGQFAMEDTVTAGVVVRAIMRLTPVILQGDAAKLALLLYRQWVPNWETMLNSCSHGRYLSRQGYQKDLVYCARSNTLTTVPAYNGVWYC